MRAGYADWRDTRDDIAHYGLFCVNYRVDSYIHNIYIIYINTLYVYTYIIHIFQLLQHNTIVAVFHEPDLNNIYYICVYYNLHNFSFSITTD